MSYQAGGEFYPSPQSPAKASAPPPYSAPSPGLYAPPALGSALGEGRGADTELLLPSASTPPPGFPTDASAFAAGSNFYIYLCCAWSTPWFMIGRTAHRLGLPRAWYLAAAAFLCTAGTFALFSIASDPLYNLQGGARVGLLAGAGVFALGFFAFTALVRGAFRDSRSLPGTLQEDCIQSTPWVLCLPCYANPAQRPQQCSPAFQLALMETALVAPGGSAPSADGASGGAKEEAINPSPARAAAARSAMGGPGGPQPRWSSDLFGCTCNQRCEGDVPLCACACAYGWWMQTRLMKRMGRLPVSGSGNDFCKAAAFLFCMEGLPDLWDFISAAANVAGAAADTVGALARLPVVLINWWVRRQVRDRYGIPEGFTGEDCLISCCCYPCAIAQQDRELTLRGEEV